MRQTHTNLRIALNPHKHQHVHGRNETLLNVLKDWEQKSTACRGSICMSGMYNLLEITFCLTIFFGSIVVLLEPFWKRPLLLVNMFWVMLFVIITNTFQHSCEMSNELDRKMACYVWEMLEIPDGKLNFATKAPCGFLYANKQSGCWQHVSWKIPSLWPTGLSNTLLLSNLSWQLFAILPK